MYSKNITARVGGLMPDFFMRNRKKIRRGGGGYTLIFGVYSNNITGGGGEWSCQIFLCVLENY